MLIWGLNSYYSCTAVGVNLAPPSHTEGSASSSHRRAGRRIHRAGARGAATLPRAVPRNFPRPAAPWSSAAERPRRSFGESPASCTEEQRLVSSRRPKHLFYTALTSSRRAATRARSTNFAKASRPRKNLPSLSHNHFGERRGAGSESSGTDTHFFGRARRRETLQSPVRLREPF